MAQDISNLAINASFQSLVQVSSSAEGNMLATATGTDFTVATASYALTSENQESASYAASASNADFAIEAGDAVFATTAGTATLATTASYAVTAGTAQIATTATSASIAQTATSASYALVAQEVLGAIQSASFAENARTADSASVATLADNATTASLATRNFLSATNDFSEITFADGAGNETIIDATPRQLIESVKNSNGTTLIKGTPVYVSGSTGNAANVYAADAGDASKMPATFILEQTLDPGEEGTGILQGFINGVSTIGFEDGEEVYVAVGGGYTNVRPTGTALVQKLGNIINGQSVNGSGVITGAGRANALPNITSGYLWVGNENQQGTAVSTASLSVASASNADRAVSASIADDIKQGIDVSFNSGSFNDLVATSLSVTNFTAVTSSVVITGDAFIQLNNDTPVQRYAGIKVQDSGSNTSASFQYDGQTDDWFYEYQGDDPTNFGVVMFGPEYGTKGSPIYPSANTLLKGNGGHHAIDSTIVDDGFEVFIYNPLTVTGTITGSLFGNVIGNADTATSASHAVTAGSATSASFAQNAAVAVSSSFATFAPTSLSSSFAENSAVAVSASFSEDARTADSSTSASFASTISSNLTQNITINGAVNGGIETLSIASTTASMDMSTGNFFELDLANGVATHLIATNVQAGQTINLKINQNATTAGTLDFNSQFQFAGGTAFEPSTDLSAVDLMSFVTFDTSNILGTGIKALA